MGYFYAAQQGKTSADIPDKTEAAQVIQQGLSSGGIKGLQAAMTATTNKMETVLGQSVDSAQQNVWNLFGVGGQYSSPGSKGSMGDSQFVETTLESKGLNYNTVMSQIPPGKKGVINNKTGEVGVIDPTEFDPSLYTSL